MLCKIRCKNKKVLREHFRI
ncbi:MAG: hypothetical protein LBI16_06095 [Burkholderiales bacterium]|nr:hypothetical protein [Burkholderiales bacterium]